MSPKVKCHKNKIRLYNWTFKLNSKSLALIALALALHPASTLNLKLCPKKLLEKTHSKVHKLAELRCRLFFVASLHVIM